MTFRLFRAKRSCRQPTFTVRYRRGALAWLELDRRIGFALDERILVTFTAYLGSCLSLFDGALVFPACKQPRIFPLCPLCGAQNRRMPIIMYANSFFALAVQGFLLFDIGPFGNRLNNLGKDSLAALTPMLGQNMRQTIALLDFCAFSRRPPEKIDIANIRAMHSAVYRRIIPFGMFL